MSSKYEFIEGEKANYPIVKMCVWAKVSKAGFYEWRNRPTSATARRRDALAERITEIFNDSDQTYGYRRVHAQLARDGIEAGPELVRSIMAAKAWWPASLGPTRPPPSPASPARARRITARGTSPPERRA